MKTCPACGQQVAADEEFCPWCGSTVAALASAGAAGLRAQCPTCGWQNRANAQFCGNCGRPMPHGAEDAAVAAQQAATSSSGRDPAGEAAQRERTAFLARRDAERAERDALPPPPTGRGELADLAEAEEHFTRVDAAWDALDQDLKQARSSAGMFPSAADAAELADLQRRTDAAWRSRQAAYAHRQRLWDQERQTYGERGLPPGEQW